MIKKLTAAILCSVLIINAVSVIQAENLENNSFNFTEKTEYIQTDIEDYTNNEALVLYKDGSVEVKTYNSKYELEEGISDLINNETVDVVQPNYTYENTAYTVNDELYNKQWALENDGSFLVRETTATEVPEIGFMVPFTQKTTILNSVAGVDINIAPVWDIYNGGRQVVIALIDTGVDIDHEDLSGAFWINTDETESNGIDDDNNGYVDDVYGYNFYNNNANVTPEKDENHGTHCAGTISAVRDNQTGIAGIASNANVKIMPLKALGGPNGEGTTASIIEAIKYAENNGAVICNLSLSTPENDVALYKTMAKSGMLFVVAAGNSEIGENNDITPHYPASYDLENVISVANIRADGKLDPTSNYGAKSVHLAAPGSQILSTTADNSYGYMTGTSMAAPMVSAVCALLYSYYEDVTLKDVKEMILSTVTPMDSLKDKVSTGGMLNAGAAFNYDVSLLKHESFNIPPEALIEEEPTKFEFEIYESDGVQYLKVTATDINNDTMYLRYLDGKHEAKDFMYGRAGKAFTVNKNNECTFIVHTFGEYTFYALDRTGHETIANVTIVKDK